jgi:hypothetical protein
LSFLQGDYYSYSNLNGSVEDVSLLNVDRPFKLIYKDFVTGPGLAEDTTSGAFGVNHATGNGHVSALWQLRSCVWCACILWTFLTTSCPCVGEKPLVDHCIDSWNI